MVMASALVAVFTGWGGVVMIAEGGVMEGAVRGAIIGAVIGALVGGVAYLFRKKK
jgi:hypothetical protein